MKLLYRIYWSITWIIYGSRVSIGRHGKFRTGGSVKRGRNICIGNDFFIGKDFLLATYPKNGKYGKLKIGDNVVAQERVRISAAESVVIGDNVLMGSDILITDNNHGMDAGSEQSYMQQEVSTKPVKIGDGCWIGEKCSVLAGSTIGEKCIIGANSVVTGEIPAYTIAVGTPAKPIKRWNFESGQWERLRE